MNAQNQDYTSPIEEPSPADNFQAQERKSLSFFELNPDLCCVANLDGCLSGLNAAWEHNLGFKREELHGRRILDFLHPDDIGPMQDKMIHSLPGQEITCTNRLTAKDGTYRWLEWNGKKSEDGKEIYAVARDITLKKEMEDRIREKDAILKAITSSAKDAIIMLDNEGLVTFWNDAAHAMLGYAAEEVMGKNLHNLIVPENYRAIHKKAFPVFQATGEGGGINRTRELSVIHKKGHEIPMELSLSALQLEGNWCSVGIIRDISERKRLVDNLNERLKELDCHNRISAILAIQEISTNEVIELIVNVLPGGFREPLQIGASISVFGKSFQARNFRETGNMMTVEINLGREVIGKIDICYSGVVTSTANGYFLPEENQLIFSTAVRLGNYIGRREKEEALAEREEKYRMLAENISDVIWVYNVNKACFTFVSPSIKNLSGFSVNEALSMRIEDIATPDTFHDLRQSIREGFRKYIENQKAPQEFYHEVRQIRKNGEPIWVGINATFQTNKNRETEILGVARNIDNQKKAEFAVLRDKILLRTLIDNIPDSIYVKDTEGRKLLANEADLKIMGFESENEIVGKTDLEIFDDDSARMGYLEDTEVLTRQIPLINQERFFNDKAGKSYWLQTTKVPLYDEKGNVTGLVGIGHNITHRKEAEMQLIRLNEDLKQINATKDKLFSIIAHDLRGPIGNFTHVLELLTTEKEMDEQTRHSLMEELKKSSKSTFSLLENLLNWSRIQTNSIKLDPKPVLIYPLISDNVELLTPSAKNKSITISIQAEYFTTVVCDADSIDLVIRNLISNAIKFTPKNGSIVVSVREAGHLVELEVADTGVGIAPEVVNNLFKSKFYSTFGTEKEKGSGLGLSLCKDFVVMNGGELWAESTPGQGSQFKFTLPGP